jgi:hypothetical protein
VGIRHHQIVSVEDGDILRPQVGEADVIIVAHGANPWAPGAIIIGTVEDGDILGPQVGEADVIIVAHGANRGCQARSKSEPSKTVTYRSYDNSPSCSIPFFSAAMMFLLVESYAAVFDGSEDSSYFFPHLAMWATNIPPSSTVFNHIHISRCGATSIAPTSTVFQICRGFTSSGTSDLILSKSVPGQSRGNVGQPSD